MEMTLTIIHSAPAVLCGVSQDCPDPWLLQLQQSCHGAHCSGCLRLPCPHPLWFQLTHNGGSTVMSPETCSPHHHTYRKTARATRNDMQSTWDVSAQTHLFKTRRVSCSIQFTETLKDKMRRQKYATNKLRRQIFRKRTKQNGVKQSTW